MPPQRGKEASLDDVEVLGAWNFTLQADTPLHWLKSGVLDRYLLKFQVQTQCPSTCGVVLHAEADQAGTDGVSFWVERRPPKEEDGQPMRRYILSGSGLDSRSVITRPFPDDGASFSEDVEILVQGYTGAVFLQNRKVTLKFKMKQSKGCVAFYNSSSAKGGQDDVHFSDVRMTVLRRGPLEVQGALASRECALRDLDKRRLGPISLEEEAPCKEPASMEQQTEQAAAVPAASTLAIPEPKKPGHPQDSLATLSTMAPSASDTFGASAGSSFRPGDSPAASPAALKGTATAAQQRHRSGTRTPSSAASPPFIRRSSSESATRKPAAASMWGLQPAPRQRFAASAVNAPDREFKVLQPTLKSRGPSRRTCSDFIKVES